MQYSDVSYGAIPTVSIGGTDTLTITNGGVYTGGLTTSNTGGYTFANTVPNTVWTTSASPSTIGNINWGPSSSSAQLEQSGKMSLRGDNADVDINGKSLVRWMEAMEERMNWMQPNVELEKEWDDLKKLGDRYRKLEKKCKEKAEVWKKLKQMPPPRL
jgi:hypothetical protein